jgi:hypothetical protein
MYCPLEMLLNSNFPSLVDRTDVISKESLAASKTILAFTRIVFSVVSTILPVILKPDWEKALLKKMMKNNVNNSLQLLSILVMNLENLGESSDWMS